MKQKTPMNKKEKVKKVFQKSNNVSILFLLLMVVLLGLSIYTAYSYFYRQKDQKINLMPEKDLPVFEIVDKANYGNVNSHTLIHYALPNLNPSVYQHNIFFAHEARLNLKQMKVSVPLYLKIKTSFNTKGTIQNPDNYFVNDASVIQANGSVLPYDDHQRPRFIINPNTHEGMIAIKYAVEEPHLFRTHHQNPELYLVAEYDIVDANGKSFSGGTQTIVTKIQQTV